jgi:hypothetical protein
MVIHATPIKCAVGLRGQTYAGAYRARLNANLAFYDGLDGKVDWPFDNYGQARCLNE